DGHMLFETFPNMYRSAIGNAFMTFYLVNAGDMVKKDDSVLVLESEKATMEIPSEFTGTVKEIFVTNGDTVTTGQKLISIEVGDEPKAVKEGESKKVEEKKSDEQPKEEVIEATKQPKQPETVIQETPTVSTKVPFASPSVRRFARELGADLNLVNGSGAKGRILKEDVQNFVKSQLAGRTVTTLPQQPEIDYSQWGDVETLPLNKIRRITGERMTTAWQTIPQVTNFDKIDITELDGLRKSMQKINNADKGKITLLPFIMKACANALVEFPDVNSSLSANGQELVLKKYYHIRVAVDTPEGLMVPVVRDVDKKNIFELSDDLSEISSKARNKRLLPDELAGGTFTISSLGGIGGTYFTPIVNPPEVAILGVSRSKIEPVFDGNDFKARLILPLTLSYDHRVVDGALAARFMKYINEQLTDIKNMSNSNLL
ncbi:MAG: 2-oxo acid dehydrogenase subunit E2, partial [Draconibacterium sp.]|nr:2-oxo acid dehydrogenase subunit E2 [Draconibacterium sp.]